MRFETMLVDDARPYVERLVKLLRKEGHAADLAESDGCFSLTVNGRAAPFRVSSYYGRPRLELVCPGFGRREVMLSRTGKIETPKVAEAVEFYQAMKADHDREEMVKARLAQVEKRYGLTRGKHTNSVSFSGVGQDLRVEAGKRTPGVWMSMHLCLPLDVAEQLLDILASAGLVDRDAEESQ